MAPHFCCYEVWLVQESSKQKKVMSFFSLASRLFRDEKTREFIRFACVGVLATAIHYGLYLILINVVSVNGKLWTNTAYAIGYVVSWLCNLWLTAHFTFQESITFRRGIGFAICHLINFVLHLLFLNFFLKVGIPENYAPVPVYCIVVPINFILVRTVFKKWR